MNRQIVLDTETTGLSPKDGHRIIEIGCLELFNRRLTGNSFHVYINPERDIEFGAQEVHGITSEFLQDKPVFADVVADFIAFVEGSELIIHNAPFDVGFINHEFTLLKRNHKKLSHYCAVVDTLTIARKKHPGQHNSLDALCKRYNVDNSNRDLHGALLDSELLAQVYLLMTGGQATLFSADKSDSVVKDAAQFSAVNTDRQPLSVIKARQQELDAHEEFLQLMRDKGACQWDS